MANTSNEKQTASKPVAQSKSRGFLRGVKSEFKKIIWPTKKETVNYTLVVVVISIIVSLIVYLLDLAFSSLLKFVI